MQQTIYQLPLTFEQILNLVRQLPPSEQIKLSQEISKNTIQPAIKYRTQTFKDLLQQVSPIATDFDPDQAKADYLTEKHSI